MDTLSRVQTVWFLSPLLAPLATQGENAEHSKSERRIRLPRPDVYLHLVAAKEERSTAMTFALLFIFAVAALSVAQKRSPFALLARWCVLCRAACILLGDMAEGAWARRNRWEECVQRARRF
jgi:hypothetical protein